MLVVVLERALMRIWWWWSFFSGARVTDLAESVLPDGAAGRNGRPAPAGAWRHSLRALWGYPGATGAAGVRRRTKIGHPLHQLPVGFLIPEDGLLEDHAPIYGWDLGRQALDDIVENARPARV